MSEPATDLAVAVAVASSYYEQSVSPDVCVIGEIGAGSCSFLTLLTYAVLAHVQSFSMYGEQAWAGS